MPTHLTLDLVSDISCPWCAVGLSSLLQALQRLQPDITATLHCQPFELNPHMGPGGQDVEEHLRQKYGSTPEQQAQIRDTIRQRGAEVGFAFHPDGRGRVYNTFDAHRLLYWAGEVAPEHQLALKLALLQACHRDRQVMDDPQVLLQAVAVAGLQTQEASRILGSDTYRTEVRARQSLYQRAGIQAVPALIIDQRYLVSGGQTVAVYEQVLMERAAEA